MNVQDFMIDFLSGRITTPFRASEDGLSLIDGRGKTVKTFETTAEAQAFADQAIKFLKKRLCEKKRGSR